MEHELCGELNYETMYMYLENRTFRILLIASPAHCVADQIDWVFDLALVEENVEGTNSLPPPDQCIARNRLAVHVGTLSKERELEN